MNGATSLTLIEPIAEPSRDGLRPRGGCGHRPVTEDQYARAGRDHRRSRLRRRRSSSGSPRAVRGLLDIAAKGATVVYGAMYPHDYEMPLNLSDYLYLRS
jgi:(R,R)-butanediol dehydrogenase/meso-butanediol dehydrogenase/diacetyl reductase/L-iditol 2-dehydrogenase